MPWRCARKSLNLTEQATVGINQNFRLHTYDWTFESYSLQVLVRNKHRISKK